MDVITVSDVVDGIPLSLLSSHGVFSKKRLDLGTRILLENLDIVEEGVVADVGCGYGPIGIFVALKNPKLRVYMLDVNDRALALAKENVRRYNLEGRVTVLKSDALSGLPQDVVLDAIYSNPPLNQGLDFLVKLSDQAYGRLRPGGLIEVVVYKGEKNVLDVFGRHFQVEVKKRSKGYSVIKAVKP
ncbi:MAG: class I SAM-dependent methyltransferase [Thermoprotei archaeon]